MSRDTRRGTHRVRRTSDEAEPFNAGAPRVTEHAHEGADQSLHKGVHIRVKELRRVASTDHELEAGKGRRDREIDVVEEGFYFRGTRHGGELGRDPVGDEGKQRALRKRSAPNNEPNHCRSREGRGNFSEALLIQGFELEL